MKKILFLFVAAFVCALGANAEVWKKVTSAPADWSGKYLIACDNGEDWAVLDGSRSGDPNSGNLQSTMNYKPYDVNADGNIELDACDYYVTIAKKGDAYTICTASGWYIGNNADANTLGTTANEELAFLSTISLSADQGVLITAVEGGSVLRYNHMNGQDRFRFYKSSTYTAQQKIALYQLEEAQAPVVPEIDGYEALSTADQLNGGTYLLLNRFGWGVGAFTGSKFSPVHVEDMDTGDQNVHNTIWIYNGEVNGDNLPSEFEFVPTAGGKFYMKDAVTGKYVNGTVTLSESDTPSTEWYVTLTDPDNRYFEVSYDYNNAKYSLQYDGYNPSWWPYYGARTGAGQPMRLYRKGGVNGGGVTPVEPVEPTTTFKGVVTSSITSVSSLAELEGIQLTFVDAEQVNVLEDGDGIYVQSKLGDKIYAIWHPLLDGTYEVDGNVVTLRNFYTDNTDGYFDEIASDVTTLYLEDYGSFDVSNADADWDGYFQTISVAYEGVPVAQPFDLVFKNNNVLCASGNKVEANEAGIATDFYLDNEGLTAVGTTATLYKDGQPMSFAITFVDNRGVSFFGGSSLITEPGTYILEVPAGTYKDAAGNLSNAFYGTWVLVEKGPSYVEPVLKAEDVSADVAYYIYTTQRGGLTVTGADATGLVGTSEAGVGQTVDPTDVRQQFAFVNWEGQLYLYNLATQKFLGKGDTNKGLFTDTPVDPILFKNAGNGTVMLYFDNDHNINLGGSKQVTIDNWKTKDAGNSFIIKVAEPFDQSEIFDRLNATEWNGNINYSEANSIEDLLDLTVEFEGASSVEASGYDILGFVFDEEGMPYGIVEGNGTFDSFGAVAFKGSKVNLKFQKLSDLGASAKALAMVGLAKIGGFQPSAGNASVVFASNSFVIDGALCGEMLCHEYTLGGNGLQTGINAIEVGNGAQIYDLQGRRVRTNANGMYIVNGKKVIK